MPINKESVEGVGTVPLGAVGAQALGKRQLHLVRGLPAGPRGALPYRELDGVEGGWGNR